MISVVIPTRGTGDFTKLTHLLNSLKEQTLQAEEILIIIDFDVPQRPLKTLLHDFTKGDRHATSMNIALLNQDGYRVSAARNYGVAQAKGDYVLLCDDDIVLHEADCLEKIYEQYHTKKVSYDDHDKQVRELIFYPTITFHDTGHVQTQGFVSYNRLLCRPVPKYSIEWKSKAWKRLPVGWVQSQPAYGDVQLIGSICVFAAKGTLVNHPYDEKFVFIYEDLERSYRAYRSGVAIVISDTVTVQHRESEKDMLARSYIDTPEHVYLKTRHRIRFALRHARGRQLLSFYLIGFWVSNLRTLLYIYLYGTRKDKLRKSRRKGIVDGLRYDPPSVV
ncbi:MAG: glycosyltransferase family 2 protein [Candidatus Absconditabacterales bacterium]